MIKLSDKKACDILDKACAYNLGVFTRRAFCTVDPGAHYLHNWHIDCISEHLQACTKGQIKRLIINVPPRYLKSMSVTVSWPAWLLGNDPRRRILAASYSQQLSTKHSLDCRHLINSPWYRRVFPNVILAGDENQKMRFETTEKGHRIATSVGGSSTGEGGDFLIVDDPHNPKQAASDVQRISAINWFDQTFATRLNNKKEGVIVLVMQRLHEEDLTGHLLAKGGWEHLNMPATAEETKVYQINGFKKEVKAGDILHEKREGKQELARIKLELGSYAYAGQYQQRPTPASGGMFKKAWFKPYTHVPDGEVVQSWDTASKAEQINDCSVCTTWVIAKDGYYLIDVVKERLEYPSLKKKVMLQYGAFNPNAVLVEDKSSGLALIQDLRKETKIPIIAINPVNDKITRASAVSALVEAGKVFLPDSALWKDDYVNELLHFPFSTHDDQVDSTSQFLNWVADRNKNIPRIRSL